MFSPGLVSDDDHIVRDAAARGGVGRANVPVAQSRTRAALLLALLDRGSARIERQSGEVPLHEDGRNGGGGRSRGAFCSTNGEVVS